MTDDRKNGSGSKEDRHVEKLKLYQAIVRDVRFTIPIIVTLFTGTVVGNADTIKKLWTPPIADGETSANAAALQQSLDSFDAAIKKLQAEDKALRSLINGVSAARKKESTEADVIQDARLTDLEAKVQ